MTRVFCNPAGQRDNPGDSVLRRPYLAALREGGDLHVLVGDDADYASGLGITGVDTVYTSRTRWLVGAGAAAVRGRLAFAANAGEYVGSPREWLRSAWQPLLAIAARVSGGTVVLGGASVRPGTNANWTHLRLISRLAGFVSWRDGDSRDRIGQGELQPDWAFVYGGDLHDSDRSTIAVVMRGDRPAPAREWFDAVRALARERQATIAVLVQVRRDRERAHELAEALDATVVAWPSDADHRTHEASVREFYRTCSHVVSDRIHALIIGATEGAAPLAFSTTSPTKIDRTFAGVLSRRLTFVTDDFGPGRIPAQDDVLRDVSAAAETVTAAADRLTAAIRGTG